MKATEFCYWLQGFFEIGYNHTPSSAKSLTSTQIEMIERHLEMVFAHDIDPKAGSEGHQHILQEIHDGLNTRPNLKPRC